MSRFKKIWIAAVVIFLILLTAAWLWWAHVAHERLQAAIAEIAALHEPVYASDLDFSPLPDNRNSAFYYRAALAAMSTTISSPSASSLVYSGYPPFPPAWHQMMDQAMAADAAVFPLVRSARKFEVADWGTRLGSDGKFPSSILNYISGMRDLAWLLADAAEDAHLRSDDARAIQYVFDLLHLADALGQRGFVIGQLVDVGIEAMAMDRIQVIAPDLQIQGDSNTPNAASHADVEQLINQLLDDQQESNRRKESMMAERVLAFDQMLIVRNKATILRPMLDLDAIRVLQDDESIVRAASQSNYPAARALYSPGVASQTPSQIRLSRVVSYRAGQFGRVVDTEFRGVGTRRLAAVSLAVRLYRLDQGRWPANLNALVGKYLPRVPEDPFYATHQLIGYVLLRAPNGGDRPMVFFDPRGVPDLGGPPNSPCVGWIDIDSRQWRDLSDWWLRPATTKKATP
jgi:hypothetical protein